MQILTLPSSGLIQDPAALKKSFEQFEAVEKNTVSCKYQNTSTMESDMSKIVMSIKRQLGIHIELREKIQEF